MRELSLYDSPRFQRIITWLPTMSYGFPIALFQALDGFLLVLTEDMKVLFVSESVRDYLGYCQVR